MKISPMPSTASLAPAPIDQNTGTAVQNFQNIRTLKMKTNFNPTDYDQAQLPNPPISDHAQAATEETQPLSPQFAALQKQRRALQVKERALAEREKALSGQSGQTDQVAIARLKSEPLRVLLENGVTYEDLTQAILSNPGNSELYDLRRELNSYKEEVQKQFQDRETAAEQQALMEMANEARSLVQNSKDFELIRSMGHLPDVTRLIERVYRQSNGKNLLSVHQACEMIENELFEDVQRVAGLEKVRNRFSQPIQQPPMQRHSGIRTLTNRDTATVPLTAKQRAIAAFQGTLRR